MTASDYVPTGPNLSLASEGASTDAGPQPAQLPPNRLVDMQAFLIKSVPGGNVEERGGQPIHTDGIRAIDHLPPLAFGGHEAGRE